MDDSLIQLSDAKLVTLCRSGDEAAWKEFIRRFGPLIYGIIHQYDLHSDEKDDVFGHVCLIILQNLHRLRRAEKIAGFVATTTNRECLARLRQRSRHLSQNAAAEHIDRTPSAEPDPTEVIQRAQREHILVRGLELLDDRCRELVEMLFFEHPTPPYEEIGHRLGIAESSIGPIRGRCLKRLRNILRKLGFEKW